MSSYIHSLRKNAKPSGILHTLPPGANKQAGAALIEFGAIVIAFLTLTYGIIVYSIVFVSQQAVAYAAESGADAIVAVDPDNGASFSAVATMVATSRVNSVLSFLPGGASTTVTEIAPAGTGSGQFTVTVNYQFSNWGFLVSGLFPLPGLLTGQGLVNTR